MTNIIKREWPKGYTLYSMSDEPEAIHMQYFDDLAILMRIHWPDEKVTILAVEKLPDEEAALEWYVEQVRKFNAS